MRRVVGVLLSAGFCLGLAVGCGRSYEQRLEAKLERLKYQQTLDQFTNSAVGDPFQSLGIFFRPPKPLTQAQQPGLNPAPGQFDLVATFVDLTAAPAPAAPGQEAAPEPTGPPLRLHVLARVDRKATAKKKGEEAAAEAAVPRGPFVDDVRALLAAELGGPDALTASLQNDKKRTNDFKRLVFVASNNDSIRVYFFKQGEHDVALIWDIPPGQEKSPAAGSGAEYSMGSLAVGPRALVAFQGGDSEADLVETAGEGGVPTGSGQVF